MTLRRRATTGNPGPRANRALFHQIGAHESAKKELAAAAPFAPSRAVERALAIVMNWLEGETKRLRSACRPGPQFRVL